MRFQKNVIKVLLPSAMLMEDNSKILVRLNLFHWLAAKLKRKRINPVSSLAPFRMKENHVALVDVEFDSPLRCPASDVVECALKKMIANAAW